MTIVVAIGCVFVPSLFRSTIVNAETTIKSFLFIPCFARDGKIYPVYSVGWTLNLEMFFYLLFFAAMRINHRHRGSIAAGTVCLLILLGWLLQPRNSIMKFWTQTRMLDFMVGIGLYRLDQKAGKIRIRKEICFAGMGAAILLLFSGAYLLGDHFSFFWNMLWGGVLLFLCLPLKEEAANRYLKALGDMSYSLYMTHFLIIGLICRVFIPDASLSVKNTVIVIGAIAVSVLCASFVYWLFEKRLARYLNRWIENRTKRLISA